jgi:hypothetical protein
VSVLRRLSSFVRDDTKRELGKDINLRHTVAVADTVTELVLVGVTVVVGVSYCTKPSALPGFCFNDLSQGSFLP